MKCLREFWREFWADDGGQAITEYFCILAFVALLIVMVFSISNGSFADALFAAFSSISDAITQMTSNPT